jgi:glycosyltransferase involved in cell wall biosynthesis
MKSIVVLIPSYKRPSVLDLTLSSLFNNSREVGTSLKYKLGIYVALNKSSPEDLDIVTKFSEIAKQYGINYGWISYRENKGKAAALNDLFNKVSGGYDYVVTLDNDMVIKMPWLHLIDTAEKKDFSLMGFGSDKFWAHIPRRDLCEGAPLDGCTLYNMKQIAGGMMLFPREILEENKWTNKGGVYGFDDAQMCLDVDKKYVLHWSADWLEHDPMKDSSPDLKHYHDRKRHFFNKGQYILKEGWLES